VLQAHQFGCRGRPHHEQYGRVSSIAGAEGSGRVEARRGLLAGYDRDRQAERLDAMWHVDVTPALDARRKRGDDDLVDPAALDLLLHRGVRIAVADASVDVPTSGLVQ